MRPQTWSESYYKGLGFRGGVDTEEVFNWRYLFLGPNGYSKQVTLFVLMLFLLRNYCGKVKFSEWVI